LTLAEQSCFAFFWASPRAGCGFVVELAGRGFVVELAGRGFVVELAGRQVGVVLFPPGAVVVGVVVVGVLVVGVVVEVVVVPVVVVVSVGAGGCWVVVPVVVARAGAALGECVLPAAVPPAIQPFTALDTASVLASSDTRERQRARVPPDRNLGCIQPTFGRPPER
jgi:hypothetical protein